MMRLTYFNIQLEGNKKSSWRCGRTLCYAREGSFINFSKISDSQFALYCRTPGNSVERNPSVVDVTTLYLRSWLMLRNCPFLLHEIRGCGIPSAVQLNVTVLSSVGDLVTFVPSVYNSFAGTILT